MAAPLTSLEVHGFRSIDSLTLELSTTVTLLIGANGAGKSNIIDAFELLGYTVDKKLAAHVLRSGGFSQLVHRSPGGTVAERIGVKVWGDWNGSYRNGYDLRLETGPDDTALLTENAYTHGQEHDRPYEAPLGYGRESRLSEGVADHLANRYLFDVLSGCRVFHFDDTSSAAPPLRRSPLSDSETLHNDARNLGSILFAMQENTPHLYQRVVRSVRNIAPFFDDFVLRPDGESVLLRWSERGLDGAFSGAALSSGTLRFICLSVLLLQPRPPATIVLDEPELGLHPAAIHQLAELMRTVGQGHRIVAATQSVTLLGQFSLEEVAVVERANGSTAVTRPDRERLAAWLNDYSVGELWEMNLLGGRPAGSTRRDGQLTR
ncbi:AAA family ATPase [Plantibacter sp. M259]|uniref:AAA family ATPase n=1 Tax=Plantibacter sp. M259 TaxID=2583822 RepID=UPI00111052E1|nr:AAA family ATPase [Plantibacter sp. M259]